jgi:NAD(P)-dependent dehydrogenase (short-subunit alcohol dehydrogenase family)
VNTMGIWATTHHAAPHMEGGSIVNVSSVAGLVGVGTYAAYAASKAAVISLTQTSAVDLSPMRIRVNCVCPGSIDTPMLRQQENADAEIALIETASVAGAPREARGGRRAYPLSCRGRLLLRQRPGYRHRWWPSGLVFERLGRNHRRRQIQALTALVQARSDVGDGWQYYDS